VSRPPTRDGDIDRPQRRSLRDEGPRDRRGPGEKAQSLRAAALALPCMLGTPQIRRRNPASRNEAASGVRPLSDPCRQDLLDDQAPPMLWHIKQPSSLMPGVPRRLSDSDGSVLQSNRRAHQFD